MQLYALDPLLHLDDRNEYTLYTNYTKSSPFVQHFYEVITLSIKPPFAISLDGLWGTGKTTIMKVLEHKLEVEGYPTFWFNPWEYRQTENVVLAFLQRLAATYKDHIKEMKESGGKIFRVLLHSGIGAALKIYTKGNVSLNDIKDTFQEIEEDHLPSFKSYQNSIETVKEEFRELINTISKNHHNKPVIIFFDDLDRCLPEDAIQLLEALKNLFVIHNCESIFICGIDTRVAKQFISKHYSDIEDTFAIKYFRKIFDLTISMPYNPGIRDIILERIKQLYKWNNPKEEKALANLVYSRGLDARISSIRKYLNIINNFYIFQKFNPEYTFKAESDFVIHFLIIKEAWQSLYEAIIQEALQNPLQSTDQIVARFIDSSQKSLQDDQNFLDTYIIKGNLDFDEPCLYSLLLKYPTLA